MRFAILTIGACACTGLDPRMLDDAGCPGRSVCFACGRSSTVAGFVIAR